MADITNPQAIAFTNKARRYADLACQLYAVGRDMVDFYNANNISAIVPNEAGDIVQDGAATDGRTLASGADVINAVVRATEYVGDMEASSKAKLNTLLGLAVNTLP